jgi:hypothetical protein
MSLNPNDHVGDTFYFITLKTCRDAKVTRPRVRPVEQFPEDTRVEFPRKLREFFPIGTQFIATVKVCQKHQPDGTPNGPAYLRASDIALVPESVPDEGLLARVKAGSISGLAYEYIRKESS